MPGKYRTSVVDGLGDKYLVMIVGPSAIGKSTIMREVTKRNPSFGYVRSFTTRQKRDDEVSSYDHVSKDQVDQLLRSDMIVTSVVHPTSGDTYGTTLGSYDAKYNLLDTLSGTVATYLDLPFKGHVVASLTANPDEWNDWLKDRFPDRGPEYAKRLREAKSSIEWSLAQSSGHYWLVNTHGSEVSVADRLIRIVTDGATSDPDGPSFGEQMLSTVDRLISSE